MKQSLYFLLCISAMLFSCQKPEPGDLKLPPLFADHMVLQQEESVALWGTYVPHKQVEVAGSWGATASVKADDKGAWKLTLQTPSAGGPYSVKVVTKDSTALYSDVLIGEVWLASGQSNMEMPLKGWPPNDLIDNAAEEIAAADHPMIRMYTVPRAIAIQPLDSTGGAWVVSSKETAGDFSASAYFFAKRLQKELDIPIGIIHSSWGGTVAEAWTSEASLKKLGDFDAELDLLKNPKTFELIENWFSQFPSKPLPVSEDQWEAINFDDLDAAKPDFNDQQWLPIEIPGPVDMLDGVALDGVVWIRRTFEISDISADYILRIGAVDDMDATFINGKKVGGLTGEGVWNVPREMLIEKNLLKKGTNSIAIRIIDTGGGGSVMAPIEMTNNKGVDISLAGTWKSLLVAEIYLGHFYVYGLEHHKKRPDMLQMNPNLPSVLFNGMINPLIPYTIKGAIWYQGESNVGRAAQYLRLFPTMINDWRQLWGKDFPFYYVQIAPYTYVADPEKQVSQQLREAQRLSLKTPYTGMVVTLDIGNPDNIHPGNKKDVGSRLAGLALANNYGMDLVASGPLYKGYELTGHKMILEFDHVGGGLKAGENGLVGFEIAGDDKVYKMARASIVGNTVVLESSGVSQPVYARYAWRDDSSASLFNMEGLPASSFSTEE